MSHYLFNQLSKYLDFFHLLGVVNREAMSTDEERFCSKMQSYFSKRSRVKADDRVDLLLALGKSSTLMSVVAEPVCTPAKSDKIFPFPDIYCFCCW